MVRKKLSKKEKFKRNLPLIFMSLPAVVLLFCFGFLPKFGIILAFQDYNYVDGFASPFVGLDNFKYVFGSGEVWRAVKNTILYHFATTFTTHILAIACAIMLYIVGKKAARTYQFAITMPYVASAAILAAIVYIFLRYDGGVLNNLLVALGEKPTAWYLEPKIWPFVLVLCTTWFGAGIKSIYFYSIFMGIDISLFEATEMDGGTWYHKIRYIMLPEIVPIVCLFLIQSFGHMLSSNFAMHYSIPMNSSALYSTTDVLSTYEYRGLMGGNIGSTSAVGIVVGIVTMISIHTMNAIVRKASPDNSMY